MQKSRILIVLMLALALSSCFKEEEPVTPFPRGNSSEAEVAMGPNYSEQIYFDLGENKVVKSNSKYLWDIAFSCAGDSSIRLNSGRNMRAALSSSEDFSQVTDTNGMDFKWDWSNGKIDSTALYKWTETDKIFVLDLGSDDDFNSLGFIKAKFEFKGNNLSVEYAFLNEQITHKVELVPDENYNYTHFSFLNKELMNAEPTKDAYDLLFTQYVYYFDEEELAYLVVGTLINPYQTECYREFEIDFSEIEAADIEMDRFEKTLDIIGYDWKYFNLGEGTFVVLNNQNYVLKDSEGFYHKLHFTGFYNTNGEKGYPVIAHSTI